MTPTHSRALLTAALIEAHHARRGVPPSLEPLVRSFARDGREAGVPIERVLVDIKVLLTETVYGDADLFAKRVVGWTVAGYFHGTAKQ